MTATTSVDSLAIQLGQILASRLGPQRYDMWFKRGAKLDYLGDDGCLQVTVPNRFAADWIQRHFQADLNHAAEQVLGRSVELRFQISPLSPPPPKMDGATLNSSLLNNPLGHCIQGSAQNHGFSVQHSTSGDIHVATGSSLMPPSGQAAAQDGHAQVADQINRHQTLRYAKAAAGGLAIRYHLDDFIVGPHNELAFVAAQNLVSSGAHDSSRSSSASGVGGVGLGGLGGGLGGGGVFVHGGVGLGKTHLLQGICRRMMQNHPDAQVLYTTGEQFTNEFVWAVKQNQIEAFRRKMRRLDLLAVDDVHFIANKTATQQEFLHCFNAMELTGARVVLASDCHPKLIQQFSQALVSRCLQGMVVEVKSPDVQTRMKILYALASRRGMMLSDSAASAMAHQCCGSIREMEGSLTKLQALTMLSPSSGDLPTHRRVIESGLVHRLFSLDGQAGQAGQGAGGGGVGGRPVPIAQIVAAVSDRLNIGRDRIMRACRRKETVLARALVVYLARTLTAMSYPEIASAIGRSSHSTVVTADQRIRKWLASDQPCVTLIAADGLPEEASLPSLVQELTAKLRSAPPPPLK